MPPSQPRTEEGLYWGYTVRLAHTFSAVFTKSPYKHGYDLTIGTSERGIAVDEIELMKFQYVLALFYMISWVSQETVPLYKFL